MKTQNLLVKATLFLVLFASVTSCDIFNTGEETESTYLTSVYVDTKLDSLTLYIVDEAVQVEATLTIPAGTIIKFTANGRIDVHSTGAIIAVGTAEYPIIFTSYQDDSFGGDTNGDGKKSSPAAKDWGCITNGGSSSVYRYCQFYYGGGWGDHTATLDLANTYASVTYCTFAYNYGGEIDDNTSGALCCVYAEDDVIIQNNTFFSNNIPLTIDPNMHTDASNTFHNPADVEEVNYYNAIFVLNYACNTTVTWEENEVPYFAISHLAVEDNAVLNLNPDVVLKMNLNMRIDIYALGTLNHNGAIITSFLDDDNLGDTNADGDATSPAVGDWVGVNLGYGNYMHGDNILYALY